MFSFRLGLLVVIIFFCTGHGNLQLGFKSRYTKQKDGLELVRGDVLFAVIITGRWWIMMDVIFCLQIKDLDHLWVVAIR